MEMEELAVGKSWVHGIDPRLKIVIMLVFSILVALNNNIHVVTASLLLSILLIVTARLDVRFMLRRLGMVNGFILFLWFFMPFTASGENIYSLGPIDIKREGVHQALLITIKSNAIVMMGITMLGTSSVFSLIHAMSHLYVPDKIVHLFFFCFRYIHVINDEYQRLKNAMRMRGFRPRTNMHTYKSYSYLVGMLLIRSFDRSRRILQAMKCRGFRNKFYILHHYEMKKFDYAVAFSSVAFALFILVLN